MKQPRFVRELSNVQRFLDGVKTLYDRGASEASTLLVKGKVGFGKSDTCGWYAVQNPSLFLRAKEEWTPAWMLEEFAIELGLKARNRSKDMFNPICDQVMRRMEQQPEFVLMIDEFDYVAQRKRLLDTLRDITDHTKVPLIAVGMQDVDAELRRHAAFESRICKTVEFAPATDKDVRTLCTAFTDAKIADDMIELIRRRSGGQLRGIKQAIALVDAQHRRARGEITAASWGRRALLPDDRDLKGADDE